MLDVKRIKVFREVAACGSFSAAAESLSFTQSAVSQQVAALERETGTQLLDRTPRGVRPTESGRALLAHADAILARLESAEDELAELAGLRGGRLRLAGFQSAGATLMPQAVATFHERHPKVELGMVEAEPAEAVERLRSRRHRHGAGLRLRAAARVAGRRPGADPPAGRHLRRGRGLRAIRWPGAGG